ncbi:arabinogalactan endo-1,4-beta-galactosidase [Reticulomyxa filosa]|uniref:arabinogalactan endo-beta-1,4-galactanase n=1 Tax=Reticulomyxa filosa TaxID=46433 RepID=X6MM43_RETFI|nr:arabinogalactan endo-1,4-beta-galactosidase [Reticulomyxa filosa]|eukprot:ETO14726.1 arabinogalactan endo-1,4-beta-galactosidase [Reticulomyxa filosa]
MTLKYGSVNDIVKLAKRAKENFRLLLELHFSDNFTNKRLMGAVFQWSKEIMEKLKNVDALPEIVSIGHEIENGFLFSEPTQGCIKSGGFIGSPVCQEKNSFFFASLLKSAINGIRSVSHSPRIMLHTSLGNQLHLGRNGADNIIKFYSELNDRWKVAFDVIGLTFYPILAQGCDLSKLQELKYIYDYFDRRFPIVIAETGYPLTKPKVDFNSSYEYSEEGQYLFLRDLIRICRDKLEGICTGIFWNPAYVDDQRQLKMWQGPLFDLTERTPLQVLTQGFRTDRN